MEYQSQRTKIGRFLYTLTLKWGRWLSKHKWLWYLLNLTWGILLTAYGAFVALWLRFVKKYKPIRFHGEIEFDFGNNWGGLEAGLFTFVSLGVDSTWYKHTQCHEYGHSYQNALFGPFTLFISFFPSVFRYWRNVYRQKHKIEDKPYDLAWFEGSATDLGIELDKKEK